MPSWNHWNGRLTMSSTSSSVSDFLKLENSLTLFERTTATYFKLFSVKIRYQFKKDGAVIRKNRWAWKISFYLKKMYYAVTCKNSNTVRVGRKSLLSRPLFLTMLSPPNYLPNSVTKRKIWMSNDKNMLSAPMFWGLGFQWFSGLQNLIYRWKAQQRI